VARVHPLDAAWLSLLFAQDTLAALVTHGLVYAFSPALQVSKARWEWAGGWAGGGVIVHVDWHTLLALAAAADGHAAAVCYVSAWHFASPCRWFAHQRPDVHDPTPFEDADNQCRGLPRSPCGSVRRSPCGSGQQSPCDCR
jgi:hypothetical protein